MDPVDYFAALVAKVDDHFGRVADRYPEAVQCGSGCADCCIAGLSVTLVEARAIAVAVMALRPEVRRELAARAATRDPSCPALGGDLRCAIYAQRPLVCRSHGAPIRAGESVLEVCARNFGDVALDTLDPDCVVDQNTLSTMLAAIDAAFADSCAAPRGVRIALADLLGDPTRFFEEEPLP